MRPLRGPILLGTLLGVLLAACSSGPPSTTPHANGSRMDTTEFRRPEFRTIYDAIHAIHPDWLLAKGGPTSIVNPSKQMPVIGVFIEGQNKGYGVDKLADLVTHDVMSVRRISASESLATYGADYPWGGLVVTLSRGY